MNSKISVLLLASSLCACSSANYEKLNKSFSANFSTGNYQSAAVDMSKQLADKNEKGEDILKDSPYLAGLSIGTADLFGHSYSDSMKYFDMADKAARNNTTDSYEVKMYEKIMYNTYSTYAAMNAEPSSAKMYLNKADKAQKENKIANKNAINDLKKDEKVKLAASKFGINIDDFFGKVMKATETKQVSKINPKCMPDEGYRSEAEQKALANFTNVYTTWLYNLFASSEGWNNIDDKNFLQANLCDKNQYVVSDSQVAASGKPTVWVVFENGLVGEIAKKQISMQNPLVNPNFNFPINISIPEVKEISAPYSKLIVNGVNTEFLADMNSIISSELEQRRTGHIAKNIIFELGKLTAAIGACGGLDKPCAGFQKMAAEKIMKQETPFDTRSWASLPKEVQMVRLDMPQNRKLNLSVDGMNLAPVVIPQNIRQAIVVVRIPSKNATPSVLVNKLK